MATNRSFVCLVCGETCYVSSEQYKIIKENPICDNCKKASEATSEKNNNSIKTNVDNLIDSAAVALDTVSTIGAYIGKKVINAIAETSNTPTEKKAKGFAHISTEGFSNNEYCWQHIGCLGELYDKGMLGKWSNCVGLYMHKINGEIMYIGRAIEYDNGGFRKRLSDYCRPNGSARVHPSGQKIHANRYQIQTHLLIVGNDEEAAQKTKKLEEYYVGKYNPPWNDKLKTDK